MKHKPIIGIIGAMDSETQSLSEMLDEKDIVDIAGLCFFSGILSGQRVVIVKSGIGKVNAARCTQLLIDRFSPGYIFNTGIAGALAPDLTTGDIVIGTGLMQHDFDASAFGHAKGYLCTGDADDRPTVFASAPELNARLEETIRRYFSQKKVKKSTIATGDQFISDSIKRQEIWESFGASAVEMEGAAIAQTAAYSNIPFAVLRVISDQADGKAAESFDTFEKETAEISSTIIAKSLEQI